MSDCDVISVFSVRDLVVSFLLISGSTLNKLKNTFNDGTYIHSLKHTTLH